MALFPGPIKDPEIRIAYAVACAYTRSERKNVHTVTCKFCGEKCGPKEASQYFIATMDGPRTNTVYLCVACAGWVLEMREKFLAAAENRHEPTAVVNGYDPLNNLPTLKQLDAARKAGR